MPSKATSLNRNPVVRDGAGYATEGSNAPGVVNRKLIVATNSRMASTLPAVDALGHHGLTAIKAAAPNSNTPSSTENVYTEKISYSQLMTGLSETSGAMPCAS